MKMKFTGERFVPGATDVEPTFQSKMYQEHLNRYLTAKEFSHGKRVLDIACGVGYGTQILMRSLPDSVIGVDISEEAIEFARAHYEVPGVKFVVGDATALPFEDNSFDVVVSFETIEHVPSALAFLKEVRRVLCPNGTFIVSTPRLKGGKRSAFHVQEFEFERFKNLLLSMFESAQFFCQNNHFVSTIGPEGKFRDFGTVEHINARYLAESDYFVAVCGPIDEMRQFVGTCMVVNDDAYVLTLERDVAVLHEAENRLTEQLTRAQEALEQERGVSSLHQLELGQLAARVETLSQQVEEERTRATDAVAQFESGLSTVVSERLEAESKAQAAQGALQEERSLNRRLLDEIAAEESLMGWKPLRILRIYRMYGARVLLRQGILKVLVGLHVAEYSPPGTDSILDSFWKVARARGLRGMYERTLYHVSRHRKDKTGNTRSLALARRTVAGSEIRVCYVVGAYEGESKRYRVADVMEYLEEAGVSSASYDASNVVAEPAILNDTSMVVLMRAGYDKRVESIIRMAHERRIPVVFEVDDYVFEPSAMAYVDAVRRWPEEAQRGYLTSLVRYRRTLEACDFAITSTEWLASTLRTMGKEAFLIPNGITDSHLRLADDALRTRARANVDEIVLGYFSGTKTHDADFRVIIPALDRVLNEHPFARLLVVGPLDLPPEFIPSHGEQVVRADVAPWEELSKLIARVDINLAPLEVGNPFCEAKSELKFLDAALLKIPTIASATAVYSNAIRNGQSGFVCRTVDEWYDALSLLIKNADLRTEMGQEARSDALARYGSSSLSRQADEVVRGILARWAFPRGDADQTVSLAAGNNQSVGWVVPAPAAGSGGHRNIFRAVRHLASNGYDVRVYVPDSNQFSTSEALRAFVDREFGPTGAQFVLGSSVAPCDCLFATHWSTVDIVLANRSRARKLCYFVQDFEPYFYPMSYEYISAERTYGSGLSILTSGPLCQKILADRYGIQSEYFNFPIDRRIYHPRAMARDSSTVIFFARPEMPRRLFPLGVAGLEILARRRPDVRIVLFGSDEVRKGSLPFECQNLGSVRDLSALADLYAQATVGMAFSTSNPSLVPYEMMACGCPVIDVDYGYNSVNYGTGEGILLVPPTPEDVARGLEALLNDRELRERVSQAGLALANTFPNEEDMARAVEGFVERQLRESREEPQRGEVP